MDFQSEEDFVQVEERLEENEVHAGVEERADLLFVRVAAVDAAFARLVNGQPQRTDAAGDVHAVASGSGASGQTNGGGVDFARAAFEAMTGEPGGIRAEAVCLDDPRASVEILAVDLGHEIRRGKAEFLQAAVDGGIGQLHEAGAHRPVAAEDAGMQFIDQVHGESVREITLETLKSKPDFGGGRRSHRTAPTGRSPTVPASGHWRFRGC